MNKNTCYKILNETLIDKKEKDTPFLPGILYRTGYELTSTLNGFHYVKKLEDLEPYLSCENPYKNIVFECEHGDEFTNDGVLFASDSIQIIREVPFDEIIKYVKINQARLKTENPKFLIKLGFFHKEFAKSRDVSIRGLVGRCGDSEIRKELRKDFNPIVREQVALAGHYEDLMILRKDRKKMVRVAVAKAGNSRVNASMIHDPAYEVRIAILDTAEPKIISLMRKDENWQVRMAVVNVCDMEGLEELCMDKNYLVRKNAWMKKEALKEKE